MGVGPSTKETTKHHFRDPLIDLLSNQEDIDFCGVVVYGTSDNIVKKKRNSYRAAQTAIACRPDGVIVSLDGWGNYHIEYENCVKTLGQAGIPVVGVSFLGKNGQFVVSNKYMDTCVDINKSKDGIETEKLGENSKNYFDAKKAVAMLKIKMNKE